MALGHLPAAAVPDASGLFNLMRNLGGAIGIALIDSVIFGRAPVISRNIVHSLGVGDIETAKFVGIPLQLFRNRPAGPLDPDTQAILETMVRHAAFVRAMNEAWTLTAILTFAVLLALPVSWVLRRKEICGAYGPAVEHRHNNSHASNATAKGT
jgi:DHA2 family multidrug resistance protein